MLIHFELFGLHLQEPMTIVFNGAIALFCFYAFFQLRKSKERPIFYWRNFFSLLGVSTFLGIFGHLFYNYWGFVGKFPSWTLACGANVYAGIGMLRFGKRFSFSSLLEISVLLKSIILLSFAIYFKSFLFVTLDAVLTYILFTGVFAFILFLRGMNEMQRMLLGVIILIPSVFIFVLKINPHKLFNKDDLSHVLMLLTIICFYSSLQMWRKKQLLIISNA